MFSDFIWGLDEESLDRNSKTAAGCSGVAFWDAGLQEWWTSREVTVRKSRRMMMIGSAQKPGPPLWKQSSCSLSLSTTHNYTNCLVQQSLKTHSTCLPFSGEQEHRPTPLGQVQYCTFSLSLPPLIQTQLQSSRNVLRGWKRFLNSFWNVEVNREPHLNVKMLLSDWLLRWAENNTCGV